MEAFFGEIAQTSLDPQELEELSDEDADCDDDVTSPQATARRDEHDVKENLIAPRFNAWFAKLPVKTMTDTTRREKIKDLFAGTKIISHMTDSDSSMRTLTVDFHLGGCRWQYVQNSHADVGSTVWGMAADGSMLEAVPNMDVRLGLEGHTASDGRGVVGCSYFVRGAGGEGERRYVNEQAIVDRIGTETMSKLGSCKPLLQLLGLICADPGAPMAYAAALPFDLPPAAYAPAA